MLDDIVLILSEPDQAFAPLLGRIDPGDGESDPDGSLWCSGFLLGMAHLQDHWRGLLDMPDTGCLMLPTFLLGSPLLPPIWEEMVQTLSQRARLTACIPPVVEAIHVHRFALEVVALKKAQTVLASAKLFQ